jgi:hypothetical protein
MKNLPGKFSCTRPEGPMFYNLTSAKVPQLFAPPSGRLSEKQCNGSDYGVEFTRAQLLITIRTGALDQPEAGNVPDQARQEKTSERKNKR